MSISRQMRFAVGIYASWLIWWLGVGSVSPEISAPLMYTIFAPHTFILYVFGGDGGYIGLFSALTGTFVLSYVYGMVVAALFRGWRSSKHDRGHDT